MKTFRDLILEAPINEGDMDELSIAKNFSKDALKYSSDIKPEYKLFGTYNYGMKPNMIMVFDNFKPVFYIVYRKQNKDMFISNVENISNTKNLSFKIYAALLHNGLFDKIYTGDNLSTKNIKAHKKYLESSKDFDLYISNGKTEELVTKETFEEIIKNSSNSTQFVLKNSSIFESFKRTYSTDIFCKDNLYLLVTDFIDNYK
jgi:hypothetical protein